MSDTFLIAFREALQASAILLLVLSYFDRNITAVTAGAVTGLAAGLILGSASYVSERFISQETWTFWRYICETIIFYLGIFFLVVRSAPSAYITAASLAVFGFVVIFFDARSAAFLVRDIGLMKEGLHHAVLTAAAGAAAGFLPLFALRISRLKIPMRGLFTLPGLMMAAGALRFIAGGVGELEKGTVLSALQKGLLEFLSDSVRYMQSVLLLPGHPFIRVPLSGLADFLAGDRTAMALSVLFITAPPLFILIDLFARPAPLVGDIDVGAKRRKSMAFFNREMLHQSAPVLTGLLLLIILLHQANLSVNPLYEPVPVPVREEGGENFIRLPLSGKLGDFSDGRVKKYIYYYGNKQIIFMAIRKPDGSMGVGLDECEICRPAPWNKDALGYAQRGTNLVCKYCMTPIAIPSLNNPGGCNPIPVAFKADDAHVIISLDDLIRVYKSTLELEKKGTHF
ncbi:MAG: DUF2318 domain-containing protein [Nitrospirae bacterium]|nr:DUF2318 domain-containing protein [Nitrospirota bacterium]